MSDKMINQFIEMVKIDSESGNEAEFIKYLRGEFDNLGSASELDNYGNLIAKFPAKKCKATEPILFSCHADTVKPGIGIQPVIESGIIKSRGNTILGADDKAGIAELLEALRVAEKRPPIEIVITKQEEVGLIGVKNLDFSKIESQKGFLLDNDTLDTIVIGGPSYYTIDVTVTGKSAHAGMEPEKGINAIQAASKAISKLRLGRLDKETTANVGILNGGIIRNGVPETATFLAECRSLNHDKARSLAEAMKKSIIKEVEDYGAKVDVKVDNLCKAIDIPENSWTVITAKTALKLAGINASTTFITGFTDASIYNNHNIEMAVVGIGARLEHSTNEHIYIEDMNKAVTMIVELMRIAAD